MVYMKKILLPLAMAALSCVAVPAMAQQAAPAAAPAPQSTAPLLEPKALDILKAMSSKLGGAKSIAFTVTTAFDQPGRNNQPIFYGTKSNVALVRPNRFAVATLGDGPRSGFYYNGKDMVVAMPDKNLVAVAAAPGNVEDMLDQAFTKAGIYFPWVDLITANPYGEIEKGLKTAFYIGQSKVIGDTVTDMVAFANANVMVQMWIGAKDRLPRLVSIIPVETGQRGRQMLQFSNWQINKSIPASTFEAKQRKTARQIEFAKPEEMK
jgi:hypothetical protein